MQHSPEKVAAPIAVSIPQAAELLGVGRSSIYKLVGSGRLKLLKIGKRSLVARAALDALLSDLTREAA